MLCIGQFRNSNDLAYKAAGCTRWLDCCLALDGCPAGLSRLVLCRIPDEIVDRILDVVIGIFIFGVPFYKFAFDEFD